MSWELTLQLQLTDANVQLYNSRLVQKRRDHTLDERNKKESGTGVSGALMSASPHAKPG